MTRFMAKILDQLSMSISISLFRDIDIDRDIDRVMNKSSVVAIRIKYFAHL